MAIKGKPKKRNINLDDVARFLDKIDFKAETIEQEWRHVIGLGHYKGKKAVFKLSSTRKTSSMTRNEYLWNEMIHMLPQASRPNFTVPKNFISGFHGNLFYFIAERFTGSPLISRDSTDVSKITSRIQQIARVCFEIINLKIPKKSDYFIRQNDPDYNVGRAVVESANFWADQLKVDANKFVQIIEKAKDHIRSSAAHGDFSPRQLYDVNGLIGVIDGEHSGVKGPLYLDPVWFYLRMRIDHKNPRLASFFLSEFKKTLKVQDKETFWEEFRPIICQKYIGEMWGAGATLKRREDLRLLGEEIIRNTII
jgi:hypothetical protein